MKRIALCLLLSGCSLRLEFNPLPPPVTREEIAAALKVRDENILAIAEKINASPAVVEKK